VKYLLDTCVISELVRPISSPKVTEWLDSHDEQDFFLSAITLGEIEKGISKLTDGKKKMQLQAWLAFDLLERFNGRILCVTTEVALRWGRILGDSEKKVKVLPVIDALIAATAITNGLTLVTRNTSDMTASEAPLFDPWE
jgi:hypothetical protein